MNPRYTEEQVIELVEVLEVSRRELSDQIDDLVALRQRLEDLATALRAPTRPQGVEEHAEAVVRELAHPGA